MAQDCMPRSGAVARTAGTAIVSELLGFARRGADELLLGRRCRSRSGLIRGQRLSSRAVVHVLVSRPMIVLEVFVRATMMMLEFKIAAVAVIVVFVTFAVVIPVTSESGRERST